ncbi:MAG: Kelch repeat-containing protein [Acidimicrobiales bacterium]
MWRDLTPLPTARANLATAALDGLVYAIGGIGDPDLDLAVVDTFDPRTGRWSTSLPLPQPRGQAGAAALDGLVYVAGGGVTVAPDQFEITDSVVVYDPHDNAGRSVAPMPTARERLRLVTSGRYLYAIGGRDPDGQALSTVERYDPRSDSWATMSSMSEARYLPCAVETRVADDASSSSLAAAPKLRTAPSSPAPRPRSSTPTRAGGYFSMSCFPKAAHHTTAPLSGMAWSSPSVARPMSAPRSPISRMSMH